MMYRKPQTSVQKTDREMRLRKKRKSLRKKLDRVMQVLVNGPVIALKALIETDQKKELKDTQYNKLFPNETYEGLIKDQLIYELEQQTKFNRTRRQGILMVAKAQQGKENANPINTSSTLLQRYVQLVDDMSKFFEMAHQQMGEKFQQGVVLKTAWMFRDVDFVSKVNYIFKMMKVVYDDMNNELMLVEDLWNEYSEYESAVMQENEARQRQEQERRTELAARRLRVMR